MLSNHAEDVVQSMFGGALRARGGENEHHFLSLPLRVEPEMHGLLLAATRKEFCAYMTRQLKLKGGAATPPAPADEGGASGLDAAAGAPAVAEPGRALTCD